MSIDIERLRRRYASLSEDELRNLDRSALTEIAQKCYDEEIQRRKISLCLDSPGEEPDDPGAVQGYSRGSPIPDKDEDFAVCTFSDANREPAQVYAAEARDALAAAGIPSYINTVQYKPEWAQQTISEYQVVVPSGFILRATSVLDLKIFNQRQEVDWKLHLQGLTDEQMRGLSPDDICAGLLDRAGRLRKAYLQERQRRKL